MRRALPIVTAALCCTIAASAVAQEAAWISKLEVSNGELTATGFVPEGTRVVLVLGDRMYGGEARGDADGTFSLVVPIPEGESATLVRMDTGERLPVVLSPPKPERPPVPFSVSTVGPVPAGGVIRGKAEEGREVVALDAEGYVIDRTTADAQGQWQLLFQREGIERIQLRERKPNGEMSPPVWLEMNVPSLPLEIRVSNVMLQPQHVHFVSEPGTDLVVEFDGESRQVRTDSNGFARIEVSEIEPGTYDVSVRGATGTRREASDAATFEVLNVMDPPLGIQVGSYYLGAVGGALVLGFAGYALDDFSFEPASTDGPPLSQLGMAFGSALGGATTLHFASRRAKFYRGPVGAFAGSVGTIFLYYSALPFLRGPISWQVSGFMSTVVAPIASVIGYNLTRPNRSAIIRRHQMRLTVLPTHNGIAFGGAW